MFKKHKTQDVRTLYSRIYVSMDLVILPEN